MADVKLGDLKFDDEIIEATLEISLDTAAELMVLTKSEAFKSAKDLMLKSSLTLVASGAVTAVSAMGAKIASVFQHMNISDTQTSAVMMVSNFLNNEATLNAAMTAGTVGAVGAVASLSVNKLVNALNDITIKMDPTIISKRQSALADAFGEIFEFSENLKADRSMHKIDASYEKLRPVAEKIGFEGDDNGDRIIYEWLSGVTNEKMSPDDVDAVKILNASMR
ncbi:hypothetical protein GCM10011607_11530 [Shewanella inventionis]|uniref:Uncharacterized protein n=1 Tax=Shewanella inventionis TaxID=1738770 RepID=A0ABQ1IX99_9GAMM|nr:hypothetical protein [Shewanella inventionis]GGB52711.1 hypothetical protein GCM10011607_11530 [Shewanella inventionis]